MFFSGREERLRKKEEKLAEAWRKKLLRRWKKDRKRRAGLSAGGPAPRKEGTGLLGPAAFLAGAAAGKPRKRPGGCGGDCAHCPPHYGYRHGRWYYGRGHTHGCELGGNREEGGS